MGLTLYFFPSIYIIDISAFVNMERFRLCSFFKIFCSSLAEVVLVAIMVLDSPDRFL